MSGQADGGRNALSGFLYQAILDHGLIARAFQVEADDEAKSEGDLEFLLSLTRVGTLRSEVHDQDSILQGLGFQGGTECILIQYKYSRNEPPKEMGPTEFVDIIKRFLEGGRRLRKDGELVSGYALLTNRPLGSGSQTLLSWANGIDLVVSGTHKENTKRLFESLSEEEKRIIRSLRIPDQARMSVEDWLERLEIFGEQYGASNDEIIRGINQLIGSIFQRVGTGQLCSIAKENLVESFVGYSEARPLRPESIGIISKDELHQIHDSLRLPHYVVRREVIDKISQAAIQRAFICLYGIGGCGKTLALIDWCLNNVENVCAFTTLKTAEDVSELSMAKIISSWMELPETNSRNHDINDVAINRLKRANPKLTHPIFYLGLDGIDEALERQEIKSKIREVLNWFLKEDQESYKNARSPRASLIVTCRVKETVNEYLHLDLTGFTTISESGHVHFVEVLDFSDAEFLEAARNCSNVVYNHIVAFLKTKGSEIGLLEGMILADETVRATTSIKSEVVDSLHHPGLWRAYQDSSLTEDERVAVLTGSNQALAKMADIFMQRFYRMLRRRGKHQNLQTDSLELIFQQIAQHCSNVMPQGRIFKLAEDWIMPACNDGGLTPHSARDLWNEALSAGLIVKYDKTTWYWKHQILWQFLVNTVPLNTD